MKNEAIMATQPLLHLVSLVYWDSDKLAVLVGRGFEYTNCAHMCGSGRACPSYTAA